MKNFDVNENVVCEVFGGTGSVIKYDKKDNTVGVLFDDRKGESSTPVWFDADTGLMVGLIGDLYGARIVKATEEDKKKKGAPDKKTNRRLAKGDVVYCKFFGRGVVLEELNNCVDIRFDSKDSRIEFGDFEPHDGKWFYNFDGTFRSLLFSEDYIDGLTVTVVGTTDDFTDPLEESYIPETFDCVFARNKDMSGWLPDIYFSVTNDGKFRCATGEWDEVKKYDKD